MSSAADDIDDISALTPAIDNGDDEQLCVASHALLDPRSIVVYVRTASDACLPPRLSPHPRSLIQKNITKPLSEFVNCSQAFLKGCDRPSYTGECTSALRVAMMFRALAHAPRAFLSSPSFFESCVSRWHRLPCNGLHFVHRKDFPHPGDEGDLRTVVK